MPRWLLGFIIYTALVVSVSGCAGITADSATNPTTLPTAVPSATPITTSGLLLGHWANKKTGYVMSFYKEGTITYSTCCSTSVGDYRFIDDHIIRIEMPATEKDPAYRRVLEVVIDGNNLKLTPVAGKGSEEFTRTDKIRPDGESPPSG